MEERASSGKSGPVVIGYDGSEEAAKAIAFVAGLLPRSEALVVTAWKSISEAILAVALGPAPPISDPGDADARQRRAAESLSREGAKRASQAGLRAESVAVRADGPIWAAIAKVADQRGARLVAVGAQGRAGVETGWCITRAGPSWSSPRRSRPKRKNPPSRWWAELRAHRADSGRCPPARGEAPPAQPRDRDRERP
jgi:nucleotide-binding universal stress UspA family protein